MRAGNPLPAIISPPSADVGMVKATAAKEEGGMELSLSGSCDVSSLVVGGLMQ